MARFGLIRSAAPMPGPRIGASDASAASHFKRDTGVV